MEVRLEVFSVTNVAATNATTTTSQVIGFKNASITPPTIALNPVAWLVSKVALPRIIEMTITMMNPMNERHGLQEWEAAEAYLDVEHWLLNLIKD